MANSWFRMYSEFATDPKVQMLSESDQRRFLMMLIFESQNKLKSMTYEETAFLLRISLDDFDETYSKLLEIGLINDDGVLDKSLIAVELRPKSNVWASIRDAIFKRDDYTCKYCGVRAVKLECDHIIPVSKGGSHDAENLNTSCFKCNRSKKDKSLSDWIKK